MVSKFFDLKSSKFKKLKLIILKLKTNDYSDDKRQPCWGNLKLEIKRI